jgi:osmotically-inducible protein OsmY
MLSAQDQPAPAIQKMSKADRQLTAKVRRAVVSDKTLSVEAHNIHITASGGAVTLEGTVKSDAEKQAIESKATEIAGAGKVTDNLTVSQK